VNEVLHLAGPERLSRYAFGERFVDVFGYSRKLIRAISIEDLDDYAPRGHDCSLRAERLSDLGFVPTPVEQGLAAMKTAGEDPG
jgi:dTDP-4-dehydrorhamnose reductase